MTHEREVDDVVEQINWLNNLIGPDSSDHAVQMVSSITRAIEATGVTRLSDEVGRLREALEEVGVEMSRIAGPFAKRALLIVDDALRIQASRHG